MNNGVGRPDGGAERRRFPRIEVLGQLHGDVIPLGAPVTMVDVSPGGFGIETSFPFSVGAIHEFRLTRGDDGPIVRVRARILHSRQLSASNGALRYATGVEFVDALVEDGKSLAFRMVEDLATALSFGRA